MQQFNMLTYSLETGQFWLRHIVYNPIKLKSTALALLGKLCQDSRYW